jgi:chorismate mutase
MLGDLMENENPAVVPEPVTPAPSAPIVKEDVTNTDGNKEQFVPLSRFQEVNNNLKEYKDVAEQSAAELKAIKESLAGIGKPVEEEPYLNEDAQKALDVYLAKQGFVRKAELDATTTQAQAERDIAELKTARKLSDEDFEKVRAQAIKMGAANKEGLEAAYNTVFFDQILEDKVKEALANAGKPGATAERPGNGTGGPVASEKPASLKDRIKAAAANVK